MKNPNWNYVVNEKQNIITCSIMRDGVNNLWQLLIHLTDPPVPGTKVRKNLEETGLESTNWQCKHTPLVFSIHLLDFRGISVTLFCKVVLNYGTPHFPLKKYNKVHISRKKTQQLQISNLELQNLSTSHSHWPRSLHISDPVSLPHGRVWL